MPILRFTARAQRDIRQTLAFTLARFGTHQRAEYAALIEAAMHALADAPQRGKRRPEIGDDIWSYHIAQPGRRARHVFLYRILDAGAVVQILAMPYDAMDLPAWKRRFPRR